MYHLGTMIKSWRVLLRNLRKQHAENGGGMGPLPVAELEWRKGLLNTSTFEPGIAATDFQALAKRLMQLHQQPPLDEAKALSDQQPSQSGTKRDEKTASHLPPTSPPLPKPVSRLGRIVQVQEWHLEDLQYENGLRSRESKLVSSLPAPVPPTANVLGTTLTEHVQKQRMMWSDMRVLQRKYDGRFSLKCERPVPPSSMANLLPEMRRMQTRRSFWVENYLRIDLSIVQQQIMSSGPSVQHMATPVVRYEVELELLPDGAQVLSDKQLVEHLWNWILEILDSFGKINGSETVDGPLLLIRLAPGSSTTTTTTTTNSTLNTQKAICTDVLLVPIARDICRSNH